MTEHYVTVCDHGFLPQALALHASLERHGGEFILWVAAADTLATEIVDKLALPSLRSLSLEDVTDPRVLTAKAQRTKAEFCWTMTPQLPSMVFAVAPDAQRVTYLDADVWLLRSPRDIFGELESSGKAVLITEHGYASDHDQSIHTGRFCVQFVVFDRDRSAPVLEQWAEQCLQWCYARFEDGKFGDQKYLDAWPVQFPDLVHILRDQELVIGPWGATRFPIARACVYHFHGLRLLRGGRAVLWKGYSIPASYVRAVYQPYLADLGGAAAMLATVGMEMPIQARAPGPILAIGVWVRRLQRWFSNAMPFRTARLAAPMKEDLHR